ncbi:MAG: hypothetical protein ACTSUE_20260 [Promethearchaeota archaeon]
MVTTKQDSGSGLLNEPAKMILVLCPICRTSYKCTYEKDLFFGLKENEMARVIVNPPCNHRFLVFVDRQYRARGTERIDFETISVEIAGKSYIENHIKDLQKKHDELISENYNEAFEIMREITELKKKLKNLDKEIVIK